MTQTAAAANLASPPSIACIGAGRVGATLAIALSLAGIPIRFVASRSIATAEALATRLPGVEAVSMAEAARADLVFLTVPDDGIATVAASLPWRAGQHVVHCSGATEVSSLQAAADAGALTGGFHPLQIFSDPDTALGLLAGSSVAIEGPPPLEAQLRHIAGLLGMHPIHLPPGARALYHGGAGFAASFLLSMLHEATAVWAAFGVSEADALRALLPMAQGTLTAAARKGLAPWRTICVGTSSARRVSTAIRSRWRADARAARRGCPRMRRPMKRGSSSGWGGFGSHDDAHRSHHASPVTPVGSHPQQHGCPRSALQPCFN